MHVIFAAFAILTAVAVWTWRLRMAKRGLDELGEVAKTVANAPRRLSFKWRAGKGGIELVEDPREAAAIMMMMIALARGAPLSPQQADVIEDEIRTNFAFTDPEAEDLAAHAAWVAGSQLPGEEQMRRLSRQVVNAPQLSPKELVDLDSMLVAVSEVEGLPTRAQLSLLQIYRDMAGLKT